MSAPSALVAPQPTLNHLIHIDRHGDLTLIVEQTKECDGEVTVRRKEFLVCSRTMARTSPPFDAMLYGFKEARPADPAQPWIVTLPDDNPDAFHTLLNIIHGRQKKDLPQDVEDSALAVLIAAAEKYLMLPVLRRHAVRWYSNWPDPTEWNLEWHNKKDIVERLTIARYMKDEVSVWSALGLLARFCKLDGCELVYDADDIAHWMADHAREKTPLSIDLQHLPQVYIRTIHRLRHKFIDKALYRMAKIFEEGQILYHQICFYGNDECGSAMTIAVKRELQNHSLWPLPRTEEWSESLECLVQGIDTAADVGILHGNFKCFINADEDCWVGYRPPDECKDMKKLAGRDIRAEIRRDMKQCAKRFKA